MVKSTPRFFGRFFLVFIGAGFANSVKVIVVRKLGVIFSSNPQSHVNTNNHCNRPKVKHII